MDIRDIVESLDIVVQLVTLVVRARVVFQVIQESLDILDLQVTVVIRESVDTLDLVVTQVIVEFPVIAVIVESVVGLDTQESLAIVVVEFQVTVDTQELVGGQAIQEFQDTVVVG